MKTHTAKIRVPSNPASFRDALEGLTRVNVGLMQAGGIPPLYEAGVHYQDETDDVWRSAEEVARTRWGDCEDLSAYRAAELRVSGEDPGAYLDLYKSGPQRYHAIVVRGDGSIEDPSKVLGMGSKPVHRSKTVNVIGADPAPDNRDISFEVVRIPGKGWGGASGYRGFVRIPLGSLGLPQVPGTPPQALLSMGPTAATPQVAAAKAVTSAATNLLKNPAVTAALSAVPGGAQAAALLASPTVQNAITDGAKKAASVISSLKFW